MGEVDLPAAEAVGNVALREAAAWLRWRGFRYPPSRHVGDCQRAPGPLSLYQKRYHSALAEVIAQCARLDTQHAGPNAPLSCKARFEA